MTDPRQQLIPSNAGMRLIAQTTLYNKGDFARLRTFLTESYHESALAEMSLAVRLAEMKALRRLHGKLRVEQLMAVDKHQAVVVLAAERGAVFLTQIAVEEDYPHRILGFHMQALEPGEQA
ncbi:MAG: hypothetical protein JNM70_02250 [Anaerolineae bacterium]|nr:hypothetical protein [Anaerolineae bacterium]